MWNEPTEAQLREMPELYANDDTPPGEIMIHMHFFLGGCDWYMAEYSTTDRIFFGYAILNDDLRNSEWGYTSHDELRSVRTGRGIEVDRDLHWESRPAGMIERIVSGGGVE